MIVHVLFIQFQCSRSIYSVSVTALDPIGGSHGAENVLSEHDVIEYASYFFYINRFIWIP